MSQPRLQLSPNSPSKKRLNSNSRVRALRSMIITGAVSSGATRRTPTLISEKPADETNM